MSFDNCFKCFTWWHILTITEATELKLDYYDNVTKAEGAVDYCCSLLIGSPRSVTDKLRRVLNAAARIITNSSKYDSGLSRTLHHAIMTFTGWMLLNGFSSKWLQLCTSVCTAWLHCSVPGWTVSTHHCVSKSSWWVSVRHNQQPGYTTLQTVNLWHPCL